MEATTENNEITLPPNLEELCLQNFDTLLAADMIKYAPSTPELVRYPGGHEIQFRIVPSLVRKPLIPPQTQPNQTSSTPDQSQSQNQSQTKPADTQPPKPKPNPLLHPKPEEIILPHLSSTHRLLVNKFSVTRPMLLLTHSSPASQDSDLEPADINASWALLQALGRGYMVIYNCGPESGNSQRQKHVQCFPRFEGVSLVGDRAIGAKAGGKKDLGEGVLAAQGLPYKHFVSELPPDARGWWERYKVLLRFTKDALRGTRNDGQESESSERKVSENSDGKDSYNVILVHDWMMLVPRRHAYCEDVGTNATGVAGMVWLANQTERERWEELGALKVLEYVGVGW